MEPKLIKGPDLFCDVIERVAEDHKLHVLLTGPARGYVKKRLDEAGVSYTHHFFDQPEDVVAYYHALDAYVVSSRAEGGPMAILESWATGVPLVSTKVGIITDIATHDEDALLSDVKDVDGLAANLSRLVADKQLQKTLVTHGFQRVKMHDWSLVAQQFKNELYDPLLD